MTQDNLPAGHESTTRVFVFNTLLWAAVWLLVGTFYGLLAAVKLYWPEALEIELLSFGRIRPIHTSLVMLGWSSLGLVAIAHFVVSRTSKVALHGLWFARFGNLCWNLALILGLITLSLGISRGPQEYRELVGPIATLYAVGLLSHFYCAYKTVAARKTREVYISNWYILGAFCWLTILFTIAYLPFYQQGMGNIVIQGYYMHNAVGLWFTPLALGITYYALPRMLSKPIYSYALGALAFWTNMVFYTLIGAHHFIFSPVPWWLQTTAILFSIGMMIPVWASAGNFFMTVRGTWYKVKNDYGLIFLLVGIWGYALSSTQGTIEAFKSANIYWHFTNFTVGHSHLAMYGFIAFMIWGFVYGLVPRITGYSPNKLGVAIHFWVAFIGGSIYVISISIAGILQGISWVAGESFIASVDAAAPMWMWRAIGGFMMVISHLVFFVNLWAMRPNQQRSRLAAYSTLGTEEATR